MLKQAKIVFRRRLMSQRSLIAFILLFTFCFLTTSGVILWELRRQTWESALNSADNLVAAISQDIGRNIELYDLSLKAVIDGLKIPNIDQVSPEMRQAILFDRAGTAKYLDNIMILDEHGNVVEESGSLLAQRRNFQDRSYFTAQRDNPELGLYISEPFHRRTTENGDWVIVFSRRINKPDGSFGGIVRSTLQLEYFRVLFARLKLGRESAITLFRKDGTLLVRAPYDDAVIGRHFAGTQIMHNIMVAPRGRFVAKALIDGVTRAINYTHIEDLPLVLFVAQSPDDILAGWNRWAIGIVAVLTIMCFAVAVLARVTQRELRARAKAEAEIRRREEQLRLITDHATDTIIHLDSSLIRRYVSPSSIKVLGHDPQELLERDFRDIMHPDDREPTMTALEAARQPHGRASAIYRVRHRDGEFGWIESQFSYMSGDGGFTVLVRDITQRLAMERDLAKAHEELRQLAATDALTGLANRRCFDDTIKREWRRAAREERSLTLLLLDVDRFKQFNDRYGHQQGDTCLQAVARAVTGCARRPADLVARYGGEEFVVLLPDTDEFQAAEVAERVRSAVHAMGVPHMGNEAHDAVVTVSVGCHTILPSYRSSDLEGEAGIKILIETCDQALYAAKDAGRNRVATRLIQSELLSGLPT